MRPATYSHDALDTCRRLGVQRLEFWCTGIQQNGRDCTNRTVVDLGTLIERHGPGTRLLMLARRMRCSVCGHRGGHVQPEAPPAIGTPRYPEWVRDELERCRTFIAEHEPGIGVSGPRSAQP